MYVMIGPVKVIALYGRSLTNLEISNYLRQKLMTLNKLWKAKKVHRPPIKICLVKNPWASNPQSNNNECPIQFDGVDVDTVKKLQPSKYDDAKLCVN